MRGMDSGRGTQPSFSAGRRWAGWLRVGLGTVSVLALVVMVNYLAQRHPVRWYVTAEGETKLSPQTRAVLDSLTNEVRVTVFYDREDPFYPLVVGLLREYQLANPRVHVRTVDYLREAGAAQQVFAEYQLAGATNKNLVLFDCQGRVMRIDGRMLTQYTLEPVAAGGEQPEFRRRAVAFHGERVFTSALLAVTMSRPLRAYFLTGHEEHDPDSDHETVGYRRFAGLLRQNCIVTSTLSLEGTNTVPEDCHLLIVAGPLRPVPEEVVRRLEEYLQQGGRMLVLLNSYGLSRGSGLEGMLSRWGVEVSPWPVLDRDNTITGQDIKVLRFGNHPVVRPLVEGGGLAALHVWRPRAVGRLAAGAGGVEGVTVTELAFSGERSRLMGGGGATGSFPLAVAVEKGAVPGVVTARGNTRMVVVGDSFFLGNQLIESVNNADFGAYAVNWLLDRTFLLHQVGSRPVREFRVTLGAREMRALQWTLLGGIPAGLLLVGLGIWWRRRR